jgi:hypothetical protein
MGGTGQGAGYPERFAQMSLGHNSKAWARAYSKKAQVILPPLEEYERKIVPLNAAQPASHVSGTGTCQFKQWVHESELNRRIGR